MIGRAITTVGSFSAYEYAENDEKKSYGEKYNLSGESYKEQWDEMRMIANLNSSVSRKKYINAMISFDKTQNPERFSNAQLKNIAEQYAKEIGFYDNQWKFAVHTNSDELHIHFFANRIGFDGKNKVKAHNIGRKSGVIADGLAISLGLRTAKEIGKERRNVALTALMDCANKSKSWDDLKGKMYEQGYHFVISKNIKGINGARIIPTYQYKPEHLLSAREKVTGKGYKLSQLSRKVKIKDIALILENNKRKLKQLKIEKVEAPKKEIITPKKKNTFKL